MKIKENLKALSLAFFVTLALSSPWTQHLTQTATFSLSIDGTTQEFIQVFCNSGSGFHEEGSYKVKIPIASNGYHELSTPIRSGCDSLRVDFDSNTSGIHVRSATITSGAGKTIDVLDSLTGSEYRHDLKASNNDPGTFEITGNDPWIVLKGDFREITTPQNNYWVFISGFSACTLLMFLVIKNIRLFQRLASDYFLISAILSIGFYLRLRYWVNSPLPSTVETLGSIWPDEATYFGVARHILDFGYLDYLTSIDSIIVAPGNPSYLALLFSLFSSIDAIRFLNIILSTITLFWIYKIGLLLFNRKVALFSALICSLNGQLIEYSATLLTEPFFIFTFIGFVYFQVRYLTDPVRHHWNAAAACLLLTLAALTRSILMLYPIAIGLLIILLALTSQRAKTSASNNFNTLKTLAVCLLIPTITLTAVAYKNYHYFNRFTVATGSGAALWLGSRHDTDGDEPPFKKLPYNAHSITGQYSHISPQGDKLLTDAAKTTIINDPFAYLHITAKKPFRLLIGNNYAWFFPHTNIKTWYYLTHAGPLDLFNKLFNLSIAIIVVVFGVCGCIQSLKNRTVLLTLIAPISYFVLMSAPFLAIQRYGLAIFPLLSIMAINSIMNAGWKVACLGSFLSLLIFGYVLSGY